MADVQAAETDLLHQKWGPMPVWAWAVAGLVVAWLLAKYRAGKQAQTSATQQANASEGQAVAPQFVIEEGATSTTVNNAPSAPVPVSPTPTPVTTPPGTNPGPPVKSGPTQPPNPGHPPVTGKPIRGGTPQPTVYRVQAGDNLTSIANRFHVKGGATALYNYQLASPLRSAKAKQEIRSRGMNHLVTNEEILIPPQ